MTFRKHDRIALWYTGVTCREHRMFTQIVGILLSLQNGEYPIQCTLSVMGNDFEHSQGDKRSRCSACRELMRCESALARLYCRMALLNIFAPKNPHTFTRLFHIPAVRDITLEHLQLLSNQLLAPPLPGQCPLVRLRCENIWSEHLFPDWFLLFIQPGV